MSLDIPFVRALRASLDFISANASDSDSNQVNLSFQDVLAMPMVPGNQSKRGGLQYLLSQLMDDFIRKRFKLSLTPSTWHGTTQSPLRPLVLG